MSRLSDDELGIIERLGERDKYERFELVRGYRHAAKLERERDVLRAACATIAGFDDENPNRAKWDATKAIVREALAATDAALAQPTSSGG